MIDSVFTVIGLWIVTMIVTFLVTSFMAMVMKDETTDFIEVFGLALAIVIVIFELFLCSKYVNFKTNPETYGYTRIEQGATEVNNENNNSDNSGRI